MACFSSDRKASNELEHVDASATSPPTWIMELVKTGRTGDIVLLGPKHGNSVLSHLFGNASWDHVALVLSPGPGKAYLVEWSSGLVAADLVERLQEYHARAPPRRQGRWRACEREDDGVACACLLDQNSNRSMVGSS